jgi:predicted esterase
MLAPVSAPAQAPAPGTAGFPLGQVVPHVVATSDTAQAYALYLPSTYDPARAWPVLFLMDPRGRALMPMALVRRAAERFGYIVISSYNTLSDGPRDPNEIALDAMLTDVQGLLAPDLERLYLVGFSGTARAAWEFGYRLEGHVAGIIGVGAGTPTLDFFDIVTPTFGTPVVFFGSAGYTDFNFDEVYALDLALDAYGVTHKVEMFDGPHAWAPEPVMARAVAWLELQAMRSGHRPTDARLVDSLFADGMEAARAADGAGKRYDAYVGYRAVAEDFAGLRNATDAAERAEALRKTADVRRAVRTLEDGLQRFNAYARKLHAFLQEVRDGGPLPPVAHAVERLEIGRLQGLAQDTTDRLVALQAERLLNSAFVWLSFYEPRTYFAEERPERALAVLDVARVIRPAHPQVCYNRARALTALQRTDEALDALTCLAGTRFASADALAADSNLAGLRGDERFRALIAKLRERPTPPP